MSSIHEALKRTGGSPIQPGYASGTGGPDHHSGRSSRSNGLAVALLIVILAAGGWYFWPSIQTLWSPEPSSTQATIQPSPLAKKAVEPEILTGPPVVSELSAPKAPEAAAVPEKPVFAGPSPREVTPLPASSPPAVVTSPPAASPSALELYQMGRLAEQNGKFQEAAGYYHEALDQNPDLFEVSLQLGNLYLHQFNDVDKARNLFLGVLAHEPNNKFLLNNLGVTYFRMKQLDLAEKQFGAAIEQDPAFVDALYNMACLAARRGQGRLAVSYLRKAGRLDPQAGKWAAEDPDLAGLRSLPEFKRFISNPSEG